jgi:hypothetical protein
MVSLILLRSSTGLLLICSAMLPTKLVCCTAHTEPQKKRGYAQMSEHEQKELTPRQLADKRYREANKGRIKAYRDKRRADNPGIYAATDAAAKVSYRNSERGQYMKRTNQQAKRYGLTREEADAVLSKPCAICGEVATCIDHNHETGAVRGGLCRSCNVGLGCFKDSHDILEAAQTYLTVTS